MNKIFFLIFLFSFLFVSCVQKELHPPLSSLGRGIAATGIRVNSVSVSNNQLIIQGSGFSKITTVMVKNNLLSFNESFAIESRTDSQIITNGLRNISVVSNAFFDLILSSAEASSTFSITFSVANGSITAAMLSSMGATAGQYLKYNGTSWIAASIIDGQTYLGTWNGVANIPDLTVPSSIAGDYYVVAAAGTFNAITYAVGDWVISDGYNWQKIAYSKTLSGSITTNLQGGVVVNPYGIAAGQTGEIRLKELAANGASYVALKAPDLLGASVTYTLPNADGSAGQVLTTNAAGVMSWTTVATGGTVTGVSVMAPLTNTGTTAVPLIGMPVATTAVNGYLSSADWNTFNGKQAAIVAGTTAQYYRGDNTWQTLDTSAIPENITNLYFTNARVLGVPLTGFAAAAGSIVATDTVLQSFGKVQGQINTINTASANYLIKNSTDSISGVVNVGAIGSLNLIYTPTNLTDAVNKSYADTKISSVGGFSTTDVTINGITVGRGGGNQTENTANGSSALSLNTTGFQNSALGAGSLAANTTGSNNTAIGFRSLFSNISGGQNTGIGSQSLYSNTIGLSNTAIGFFALHANTIGSQNIGIGLNSGNLITTGNNNVIIGSNTGSTIATLSNNILIADGAGNERMRVDSLGNVGIGAIPAGYKLQVGGVADGSEARANAWNILSDERLKRDFEIIPDSLDKLLTLNGYYYYWNRGVDHSKKIGLKAQEVEKVFPEIVSHGKDGFLSVSYNHLVAVFVEAIKELNRRVDNLFKTTEGQSRRIASLEEENKMLKNYLCEKDSKAKFCSK
ncbi:MAG: tail fiber domain-containing protein [Bacteriovorax sp.]|nr:tail fiber domain-containing protein [Bacteriovorax sp.]